jgi:hypothetical protein
MTALEDFKDKLTDDDMELIIELTETVLRFDDNGMMRNAKLLVDNAKSLISKFKRSVKPVLVLRVIDGEPSITTEKLYKDPTDGFIIKPENYYKILEAVDPLVLLGAVEKAHADSIKSTGVSKVRGENAIWYVHNEHLEEFLGNRQSCLSGQLAQVILDIAAMKVLKCRAPLEEVFDNYYGTQDT